MGDVVKEFKEFLKKQAAKDDEPKTVTPEDIEKVAKGLNLKGGE